MSEANILKALLDNETRSGLIEYYKWIVNLAIFVLTISVSLVGLFGVNLKCRALLLVGWIALGICIFLNWLLIKRIVTIPIVLVDEQGNYGILNNLFLSTLRQMKIYGLLQNLAFLLGVGSACIALILNWLLK